MKRLTNLFKETNWLYSLRQALKWHLERHIEMHGGYYVIITITLATCAILLQAVWSVFSPIK